MRKVLVTGFDSFGSWSVNPSWLAAQAVDGEVIDKALVVSRRLPVLYSEIRSSLLQLLSETQPDAVLLTGLAGSATAMRVEAVALNLATAPAFGDNAGCRPYKTALVADAPAALFSSGAVHAITRRLDQAHIPVSLSFSAGTFLCNAALYHALHIAKAETAVVFLHVPPVIGMDTAAARPPEMKFDLLVAAYRVVIRELLRRGCSDLTAEEWFSGETSTE